MMQAPVSAASSSAPFAPLNACWICGGAHLRRVHRGRFDFSAYREQDPALHAYTDAELWLQRCERCGFAQPHAMPLLAGFFARMYDQRWSEEWLDQEFVGGYKDAIFARVLKRLQAAVDVPAPTVLDIGAHVGRFMHLARQHGWRAEGIELNPRSAHFAAERTGLPVHRTSAEDLVAGRRRFDAVTLIDVLEHIPDPLPVLRTARALLATGGWIAVKVPNGPAQLRKEQLRARLRPGYRASVADNLVHVNHFSVRALEHALRRAGFDQVEITVGYPELAPRPAARGRLAHAADHLVRRAAHALACTVPGALDTPLALNLQAYARRSDEPSAPAQAVILARESA